MSRHENNRAMGDWALALSREVFGGTALQLGDVVGHEFHGNQYSAAISKAIDASVRHGIAAAKIRLPMWRPKGPPAQRVPGKGKLQFDYIPQRGPGDREIQHKLRLVNAKIAGNDARDASRKALASGSAEDHKVAADKNSKAGTMYLNIYNNSGGDKKAMSAANAHINLSNLHRKAAGAVGSSHGANAAAGRIIGRAPSGGAPGDLSIGNQYSAAAAAAHEASKGGPSHEASKKHIEAVAIADKAGMNTAANYHLDQAVRSHQARHPEEYRDDWKRNEDADKFAARKADEFKAAHDKMAAKLGRKSKGDLEASLGNEDEVLRLGDVTGHDFHGNQYVGGETGDAHGAKAAAARIVARAPGAGAPVPRSDQALKGTKVEKSYGRAAAKVKVAATAAEHEQLRIATMNDRDLATRVNKIKNKDKLERFVAALKRAGKHDIAKAANDRLMALSRGDDRPLVFSNDSTWVLQKPLVVAMAERFAEFVK